MQVDEASAAGRGLADTGRYIARSIRQSLRLMVGMPVHSPAHGLVP